MYPAVSGFTCVPPTETARPFSTATSRLHASGQSRGQALAAEARAAESARFAPASASASIVPILPSPAQGFVSLVRPGEWRDPISPDESPVDRGLECQRPSAACEERPESQES